jgi:adenine-specific DNA methylase
MFIQEKIGTERVISKTPESFRTIHYLGSKLRVLDFIKTVVDEIDPDRNGVCDLFSGTGSVSKYLSSERKIVSVDIQNYSNIICSALLNPISDEFINSFSEKILNSEYIRKNLQVFSPLIEFEEKLINGKLGNDLELVCNYLENSSLYSAILNEKSNPSNLLKIAFEIVINDLKDFDQKTFIATKYFGGVYFSYKQAAILDAILSEINNVDLKYRKILLASLLSTASDIVNTVGKQFAQPIRPRNKNGLPKKGIIKQLQKDRNLEVLPLYKHWLDKYSKNNITFRNHQVLKVDYKEALLNLDADVKVVYADPPYTRDHYSRFYHGLETLSLMDYPKISKTKIGGSERLSRGLYREEREQSDFCIRSKAPKAFEELFRLVSEKDKILILSYSPYDKVKGAHPRVVEIELLKDLAETYFKSVEVRSIGKFSHSKLNKIDLHLTAGQAAEVLIICKN